MPADDPARLPPHLLGFSQDLDRFSRYGEFRYAACSAVIRGFFDLHLLHIADFAWFQKRIV